jgi:hypothetical protein
LATALRDRATSYSSKNALDFRAFVADPRTREKVAAAEAAVSAELARSR